MKTIFIIFSALILSSTAFAAGSYSYDDNRSDKPNLRVVKKLLKKQQYQTAIDKLWVIEKADQDNADVYNLLGYSHRKLQRYTQAYDYYQQALQLDPKHRGANEYLGELYIETDRLAQAQQQLQVLNELCSSRCKEYRQLKSVIKDYQAKSSAS